jgi:hypothetical protein
MASAGYDRIITELSASATDQIKCARQHFAGLEGDERARIAAKLLARIEEGWWGAEQLEWLLGDDYVPVLQRRLAALPRRSPGLVFLPYFLYLKTAEPALIKQMMNALVEADPDPGRSERAIGGYLRRIIGKGPLFWDFCRYIILNVPERGIKRSAMLWLAFEKGYPLDGLSLSDELLICVNRLSTYRAAPSAIAVLNKLHKDTGRFVFP